MYWLSIISSIAGIISFVISFTDYFKKWKTYLLYVACLTIGVAIGVILSMSESATHQFTQQQVIYIITLVCVISLLIVFLYKFLTVANEPIGIITIFLVIFGYFAMDILDGASPDPIRGTDYLILSEHYCRKEQYTKGAEYLKRYKDSQSSNLSPALIDSINKRIDELYYKGLNEIK